MLLRSVLITGASSGIGEALALRLAQKGMTLYLGGRCRERLQAVADFCSQKGASVRTEVIDVCDASQMQQWIQSVGPLDLVLACAGISAYTLDGQDAKHIPESENQVRQIMQTNLQGVLNTVLPALDVMQKQERNSEGIRGQIAAIASIAGFVSSAWSPAYCASKAAVDRFMVASGAGWKPQGIYLSSICCGFVTTPMTGKNRFFMPGKLSADKAAALILAGIERKKRRIVFPVWFACFARIMDLFPVEYLEKIYLRYLLAKDSGQGFWKIKDSGK